MVTPKLKLIRPLPQQLEYKLQRLVNGNPRVARIGMLYNDVKRIVGQDLWADNCDGTILLNLSDGTPAGQIEPTV